MGKIILVGVFCLFTIMYIIKIMNEEEDKLVALHLATLGFYKLPSTGESVDLSRYYVDREGQLYSMNGKSWEINPKENRHMLVCSNNSLDKSSNIINTFRSRTGKKVTIRRKDLKFSKLAALNGYLFVSGEKVTNRHIKINNG